MTLTLDDVRNTKFHLARRSGYEVTDVDLFVDRVEATFAQLTEENDSLKREVESLKEAARNAESQRGPVEAEEEQTSSHRAVDAQGAPKAQWSSSESTQSQPAGHETPEVQTQSGPVGRADGERVVVSTSADASPAVVRLVQLATEQAEQLVAEANAEAERTRNSASAEASRAVEDAKRQATEITTDARTRGDRIESEARVNADKVRTDAQSGADNLNSEVAQRRTELLGQLETERDQLLDSVASLRGFEAKYRSNLTEHLQSQIQALESSHLEPADAPALAGTDRAQVGATPSGDQGAASGADGVDQPAQTQSSTPRLDALLGDKAQG